MKSKSKRMPTARTDEEVFSNYLDTEDQAAFEELHFRYRGPLTGYILRHYLRGQHAAVEDVVQQTFLKLFRYKDRFDRSMLLRPWLYSLAANNAINHIEYMSVRPTVTIRREDRGTGQVGKNYGSREPIDTRDTIIAEMEASEEKLVIVWAAVAGLPEHQRDAIEHVFREGLSYKEAAERMGVPTNTLGVWIHRAVQTLKGDVTEELVLEAA
jgi:RNA polymerase sigma-70 factor (ECF subfamily)